MSTLYKKMLIVQRCFISGWIGAKKPLHKAFNKGNAKLIKAEWYDNFKKKHPEYYPLDFTKSENWSTYDNGVNVELFVDNKKVKAELTIWNCDSFFGKKRKKPKIHATFIINARGLREFKHSIEYNFKRHIEDVFEAEEQQRKEERMKQIEQEIFSQ